jgi:Na+-driven multidrug efflux pump
MRQYVRVGIGSGVDSLVRNLAYFFMIIRIVNTIGATEIGGYYIAIQILWSFMLVPVLAFADSAKALVANASGDLQRIRTLWHASMVFTAGIMIIWIAAVPAFRSVAGILTDDPETIEWAAIAFGILFVPYVLFSFNTVMDSVFYGTGKTQYLAYQAVLTNGTVYAIAFLLYVTDVWEVTFEGVMVLFSLGILLDTMLTVLFLLKILYLDQSSGTSATVHTQARSTETEGLSKG